RSIDTGEKGYIIPPMSEGDPGQTHNDVTFDTAVRDAVDRPGVNRMDVPESLRGDWEAAHLPSGVSIAYSSAVARAQSLGLSPWDLISMSDRELEAFGQDPTPDQPDSK
ncbi:MAG: hypothetical protein ACD_7C00334G0001, partial [uncultured bacterium]